MVFFKVLEFADGWFVTNLLQKCSEVNLDEFQSKQKLKLQNQIFEAIALYSKWSELQETLTDQLYN